MPISLDGPETAESLYLARGVEVTPYRPVITGDVFTELSIPGVGVPHEMAMVISHPCNMRAGDQLRERIQMLPIVPYQDVPLSEWRTGGHARVFMLPESELLASSCAARFDETGMVASAELRHDRRRLCLSERGVLLLLQRQVFSQCRADIALGVFERATSHVLAEVELLEEWNENLVPRRLAEGALEMAAAVEAETREFDQFLSGTSSEAPLREQLREEHRRAGVRREVRAEIGRRSA